MTKQSFVVCIGAVLSLLLFVAGLRAADGNTSNVTALANTSTVTPSGSSGEGISNTTIGAVIGAVVAVSGWLRSRERRKLAEARAKTAETNRAAEEQAKKAAQEEALQQEKARHKATIEAQEANQRAQAALDQARRIELELTHPKPATRNGRRCSVVLLGIGDTGKSEFIRHLTNTVVDTPTVKTTEIREWEVDIPFNENRPGDNRATQQQHVTCYVTDYVGQNLGSLVEYFMIEQKTRLSKMAYGHINVLCLLVDLAKGDPVKLKKTQVPNLERVQEQIDEWNGQTLAAVWGLVTGKKFKHVVLFVNKCDAIPDRPISFASLALRPYQDLVERLRTRFPDQQLHLIAGSASSGENVRDVVDVIINGSDPAA